MTSSMSIWNNQILLHWDEVPPPGCTYSLEVLRAMPDLVLPYWKHIGKYLRYSTKKKFFFCNLSVQNLRRIHAEFGQIPINNGYRHIQDLKNALATFKVMIKKAQSIKDGCLDDISYKVPPLAPYQHIGVNLLTRCEAIPLFADCGLGKTFMVLASTQEQLRRGILAPGKTLICGKLQTLHSGWLKDCEKFTHMKAIVVWCKPGAKRKEKLLALLNTPADLYIINHDGVRVIEEALVACNFAKVVVDESTILKSYMGNGFQGGAFGKALMKISHAAKFRVIMSGTPSPNSVQDLWGQFSFLDPYGFLLEKNIHDFRASWMNEVYFGNANDPNTPSTWVVKDGADTAVGDLISPLSYRVRIRDVLPDLPTETIIERYCDMGSEQSKLYRTMEEQLKAEIGSKFISVDMALSKIAKLRQITGGFIIDHQENAHPIADGQKLVALDSLLEDEIAPEHKVVVFAQYRWEIETIFTRYKDMGCVSVYGGNTSVENMKNIDIFLNDKDVRLIVLHPASAAHGISLQKVCSYMIMYSISYSAELDYQSRARIIRAGALHPMFIYYLLCSNSIDVDIKEVIHTKNESQQKVIDQDIIFRFMRSAHEQK